VSRPEQRVYLDCNASTPLRPQAAEAMARALGLAGNPSSVHQEGRQARRIVEDARARVAALVGAAPQNVIFTSGGTEANNAVLSPATRVADRPTLVLLASAVEHSSVREGHRFPPGQAREIGVTRDGVADLSELRMRLEEVEAGSRALVSLMLANNETGVLQPVGEAAEIVRERGHILHSDVVQAAGKVPIDIEALGADVITLSAHKMGGPKGVGAIVMREGAGIQLLPMLRGGGQERSRRAGTENVAAIAGFGVAAEITARELESFRGISRLRASLEAGLVTISPEAVVLGAGSPRLVNTTAFALPGLAAETAVIAFDLKGVAVSSGAACSSGKVAASHVVRAMGLHALARSTVRVSLGWQSTPSDVERFLEVWSEIHGSIVERRRTRAA